MKTIRAEFVEGIPSKRLEGVLYVSLRYSTAVHSCMCGCGNKVVTPIGRFRWRLSGGENDISLFPSISNNAFPCGSHYFIRNGRAEWAHKLTERQVSANIARDRRERDRYFRSRTLVSRIRIGLRRCFGRPPRS
ncbi:DUF6527 family protein [Leifsonia sp. 2MCAF36]|uniref:DUF6527 family protein n=1 Tax=Leifsonia sp. 2MCAF36 TaxID=3232988 RepID=UPI003F959CDC